MKNLGEVVIEIEQFAQDRSHAKLNPLAHSKPAIVQIIQREIKV